MMEADIRLHAEYAKGSAKLLSAIQRERKGIPNDTPDYMLWLAETHTNHHSPRYESSYFTKRDEAVERFSLRVARDPCPMCGTRGDIGCKHGRVA